MEQNRRTGKRDRRKTQQAAAWSVSRREGGGRRGERKRGRRRAALSLFLAVLLLLSSLGGAWGQELLPETRSVFDGGLKSLSASAGYWNRGFSQDVRAYQLILPKEEGAVRLSAVPVETSPLYGPALTIDGVAAGYGQPSQEIALQPGEKRVVPIVVQPQSGPAVTYMVTVYRNDRDITLSGQIRQVGGSPQLALSLEIPAGTEFTSLGLALSFDPKQLQLASGSTNAPNPAGSTTFGTSLAYGDERGFLYKKGGVMDATVAEGDNAAGRVLLQYSIGEKGLSYTMPEGGSLLTLYFRMTEQAALTEETLGLTGNSASVRNGFFAELSRKGSSFVKLSYPGLVRTEGLDRNLEKPVRWAEGGRVQFSPDKESYRYGERVTVTAAPAAGYVFSHWELSGEEQGMLEEALTGDSAWAKAETVPTTDPSAEAAAGPVPPGSFLDQEEWSLRLTEDLTLSTLKPVFEKADEVLGSGCGLNFHRPYRGDILLAVNPSDGTASKLTGTFTEEELSREETPAETQKNSGSGPEDQNGSDQNGSDQNTEGQGPDGAALEGTLEEEMESGLTRVEYTEPLLTGTPAGPVLLAAEEPQLGDQRSFQMRDSRAGQTSAAGWAAGTFTLKEIRQAGGQKLYVWLCDEADRQPMALSDSDLAELADSFAASYAHLAEHYHNVTDTDGNGGLTILLYDIWDSYTEGGGTYTGGLVNPNEFYRLLGTTAYPMGNCGDVLHLDTWPQMGTDQTKPMLERAKSTMAHETQHLAFASAYESAEAYAGRAAGAWINEGLSLTMEHELFGRLDSRIATYNHSSLIKAGLSLTDWTSPRVDNYALSYLFFQYVRTQAEQEGFARAFYGVDYGGGADRRAEDAAVTELLQGFGAFQGLSLAQVTENFYLALLLKETEGRYGFSGDGDFDEAEPQIWESRPAGAIPAGGAVYVESPGSFVPEGTGTLRFTGVQKPRYTLTIEEAEGGSAAAEGDRYRYAQGQSAAVTAVPAYGYTFAGWSGDASGGANPLTVVMNGDKRIRPVFDAMDRYALTVECAGPEGSTPLEVGKVTVNVGGQGLPEDTGAILTGSRVTLRAEAAEGYAFDHWEGDVTGTAAAAELVMNADRSVRAVFRSAKPVDLGDLFPTEEGSGLTVDVEKNEAVLWNASGTVYIRPKNEEISQGEGGGLTLTEGTEVTLTAAPAEGKAFSRWVIDSAADETPRSLEEQPSDRLLEELLSEDSYHSWKEDGALLRTTLTMRVAGGIRVRAEFRDADAISGQALYLSYLSLLTDREPICAYLAIKEPETRPQSGVDLFAEGQGRGLIQRESKGLGFESGVFDYTLSLLSTDPRNLYFYGVKKALAGTQRAELTHWRGGTAVEEPVVLTDESSSGDFDQDKEARPLTPLPVKDVQDGDELRIVVSNGEPAAAETVTYTITIDRSSPETDPLIQAVFAPEEGTDTETAPKDRGEDGSVQNAAGQVRLSVYLQHLRTEAAELTLTVSKGAIQPLNASGQAVALRGKTDITQACVPIANTRYGLEQAVFDPTDANCDRIHFTFAVKETEDFPGLETQAVEAVRLLFETSGPDVRLNPQAESRALVYDSMLLELQMTAQVLELTENVTVKGTFFAWQPSVGEAWMPQVEFDGVGRPILAEVTLSAIREGAYQYGMRTYEFTASLPVNAGSPYRMTIRKAVHGDYVLEKLYATAEGASGGALNVNELLKERFAGQAAGSTDAAVELAANGVIRLTVGDITGDGRITLEDKNVLMSPLHYGKKVAGGSEGATDLLVRCDLNGDGAVTLADLNLLMSPYNYGKGGRRIEIPAGTGEGD
ncbi:InlB B-repeat-containing protein [Bacilliculturomica massiliensis]|uniref:InlB B-repeat-containing protein n=1 Tax=Bacilliculturomica massiliensis TaxID=1917867 RepID=UPI001030D537|nr:cadherin-like beta sandwich domain-containing protein [Bacilliculturomica massiliensis]